MFSCVWLKIKNSNSGLNNRVMHSWLSEKPRWVVHSWSGGMSNPSEIQDPQSLLLYELRWCFTHILAARKEREQEKGLPSPSSETSQKPYASFLPASLWPELCLMLISSCKEGCWKASILGGLVPSKGSASSECILGATGNVCRDYMVLKFPEKCTQWMSGILKEKEENFQISAAPYI